MGRGSGNLARITLRLGSKRAASAVFRAIEPEAKSAPTGRSKVEVSRAGNDVEISILSRDLSSMRAAVNTFLRLASACQGTLEALEELGGDRAPHRRAREPTIT